MMENITGDITKHQNVVPLTKKDSRNKKRVNNAEKMALLWEMGADGHDELISLYKKLSKKVSIHDTAMKASNYLTEECHDKMMTWLRWRMTFNIYELETGNKYYTDLFAIPLKGKANNMKKYVNSESFTEDMIALIRNSGFSSPNAEFLFIKLAIPSVVAATFDLDGLGTILGELEKASKLNVGLKDLESVIEESFPENFNHSEDGLVLGLRVIECSSESNPEDIFHRGLEASSDEKSHKIWGELASDIGKRHSVFIAMPNDIYGGVAFLASSQVNSLLAKEEKFLRSKHIINEDDTFDIHVCEHNEGFWVSKTYENIIIGPVRIDYDVVAVDYIGFMDSITEGSEEVISHDNISNMPGVAVSIMATKN